MSLYPIVPAMRGTAVAATMELIETGKPRDRNGAVRNLLLTDKVNEDARYNDDLAARMDQIESSFGRSRANLPALPFTLEVLKSGDVERGPLCLDDCVGGE